MAHISNVLGTINPIAEMAALADAHGAKLFVDGAQSIAHLAVDVQKLDIDFFAFSATRPTAPPASASFTGKKSCCSSCLPTKAEETWWTQ